MNDANVKAGELVGETVETVIADTEVEVEAEAASPDEEALLQLVGEKIAPGMQVDDVKVIFDEIEVDGVKRLVTVTVSVEEIDVDEAEQSVAA